MSRVVLLAALALLAAPAARGQFARPTEVSIGTVASAYTNGVLNGMIRHLSDEVGLLPGVNVTVVPYDLMGLASRGFFASLQHGDYCGDSVHGRMALTVGWGSSASSVNGGLVAAQLGQTMISSWSSSPALSNKLLYPTFSRVFPSDDFQGMVIARTVHSLGWRQIAMLSNSDAYGSGLASRFSQEAARLGLTVLSAQQVDVGAPAAIVEGRVAQLKASGARVFVLATYTSVTVEVLRAAAAAGLVGPEFVWLVSEAGAMPDAEARANPLYADVWPYFDGLLAFSPHIDTATPEYARFLNYSLANGLDGSIWWTTAWDSAELGLRALDHMYTSQAECDADPEINATREDCLLLNNGSVANPLDWFVRNTPFAGATGAVRLDQAGDVISRFSVVMHRYDPDQNCTFSVVGVFDPLAEEGSQAEWTAPLVWYGGREDVPLDAPVVVTELRDVAPGAFYALSALSAAVIAAALATIAYTWSQRARPIIRMSSPNINNLSALGTVLGMVAVIISGSGNASQSDCVAHLWVTSLAFTLIFGPLLGKIYRVAAIFNAKRIRVKVVKDKDLLGGVALMLAADLVLLTAWTAADPLTPRLVQLAEEQPSPDLVVRPHVRVCGSDHGNVWMPVLLASKALVVLKGAQLAYAVRDVDVPALNDSKWIGFAIYNLLLCSLFAVPVAVFLSEQPTEAYVIVGLAAVLAATMTLALVNGPKFAAIYSGTEAAWTERSVEGTRMATKGNTTHINGAGDEPSTGKDRPPAIKTSGRRPSNSEATSPVNSAAAPPRRLLSPSARPSSPGSPTDREAELDEQVRSLLARVASLEADLRAARGPQAEPQPAAAAAATAVVIAPADEAGSRA